MWMLCPWGLEGKRQSLKSCVRHSSALRFELLAGWRHCTTQTGVCLLFFSYSKLSHLSIGTQFPRGGLGGGTTTVWQRLIEDRSGRPAVRWQCFREVMMSWAHGRNVLNIHLMVFDWKAKWRLTNRHAYLLVRTVVCFCAWQKRKFCRLCCRPFSSALQMQVHRWKGHQVRFQPF